MREIEVETTAYIDLDDILKDMDDDEIVDLIEENRPSLLGVLSKHEFNMLDQIKIRTMDRGEQLADVISDLMHQNQIFWSHQ